ncbi:hypothetical protein MMC29_005876 [Sticta canariensis]|nr:hypothetical protein [Sticta canariensis]
MANSNPEVDNPRSDNELLDNELLDHEPRDSEPLDSEPLDNDPQDVLQDNHPRNNLPIVPQGPDLTSYFERCFTTVYPFQRTLILYLNRLDFKNLLLAGINISLSRQIQNRYLIPSKCDETTSVPNVNFPFNPGFRTVPCLNTTRTVHQIKACHGKHHDGFGPRGRQEKWNEPSRLLKHVRDSDARVETTDDNQGGHFDSFNVCIHCHDRDRQRVRPYEAWTVYRSHSLLCQTHSLEFIQQRPYNHCRCRMYIEKYWRCRRCTAGTVDELSVRAQCFAEVPYPTFVFDQAQRRYVDARTGNGRQLHGCPILGCPEQAWTFGPLEKQMAMCRACVAIVPQPPRPPFLSLNS